MSCRGIIFSGKYKMHTQTTQSLPLSSLTASHNKKKKKQSPFFPQQTVIIFPLTKISLDRKVPSPSPPITHADEGAFL